MTPAARTEQPGRPAGSPDPPLWHALDPERARDRLETPEAGLDDTEAARRRTRWGANRLPEAPRRPAWRRLAAQFHGAIGSHARPATAIGC